MTSYNFFPSFAPCLNIDSTNALSKMESKLFEDMQVELDDPTLWEKMAAMNPGMTPRELEEHFYALLAEHNAVMAGHAPVPDYIDYLTQYQARTIQRYAPSFAMESSMSNLIASLKQSLPDRSTTKGTTWSDEEHRLFLLGMDLHGKGDWRSISKHLVPSRSPSQIASHAQKFFKRKVRYNDRRNVSIYDLAMATQFRYLRGCVQNMLDDGRINYFSQLQMPPVCNGYMASASYEINEYNMM